MLNLNFFKQKSPQQRFLLILGLAMMLFYFGIGFVLVFTDLIPLNEEAFPREYQIAFGVVLMVYGLIRFGRTINQKDGE
ncbi:MAG: hypothetical protein EOO90_02015 [Pedobacter sp.]|nr:MAG: hypothetical protein EOO90_02015 [Pedobacter sp.]